MTPEDQTRIEFAIKSMERAHLEMLLRYHGLLHNKQLTTAIDAYALAFGRAAVAVGREAQARRNNQ